uniref:Plasma membrane fusion protein PRM1 n=1 Tax=Mesocestoides corti TaxID=53468 RepID=A0A5K3FVY4_MESCO
MTILHGFILAVCKALPLLVTDAPGNKWDKIVCGKGSVCC